MVDLRKIMLQLQSPNRFSILQFLFNPSIFSQSSNLCSIIQSFPNPSIFFQSFNLFPILQSFPNPSIFVQSFNLFYHQPSFPINGTNLKFGTSLVSNLSSSIFLSIRRDCCFLSPTGITILPPTAS